MWESLIFFLTEYGPAFGGANAAVNLLKNIAAIVPIIRGGQPLKDQIKELRENVNGLHTEIKSLSDHFKYAPELIAIQHHTPLSYPPIDYENIYKSLQLVPELLGADKFYVSARLLPMPERLCTEMARNPWQVLTNIRPLEDYKLEQPNSNWQPVCFQSKEGKYYVGWISLESLRRYNCEYDPFWQNNLTPSEIATDIDYSNLERLLAARNWRLANKETTRKMLQIVNAANDSWLQTHLLRNFPQQDLQEIDRLWREHSNSHFGFSIQKDIYHRLGGSTIIHHNDDTWNRFGEAVGWRRSQGRNSFWLSREDDLIFDLQRSPKGHLPRGYTDSNSVLVELGHPLKELFKRLPDIKSA